MCNFIRADTVLLAAFSAACLIRAQGPPRPTLIVVPNLVNPSAPGAPVTYAGTVMTAGPPAAPVSAGAVALFDGPTHLTDGTVDPAGHFSLIATNLSVGVHDIIINYLGAPNYQPSNFQITQTVGATKTTVTLSSANIFYGNAVTLIATVAPVANGSPTEIGVVTFYDGGAQIAGSTRTLVNGAAAYTPTSLILPGTHSITANFSATDGQSLNSTSSPVTLVVNKAFPVMTASTNPRVVNLGQTVTLSAALQSVPGGVLPTGTVQFVDATTLGTANVAGGAASITATFTRAGNHIIQANYRGDALYAPTSATTEPMVNQLASTLVVTTSASSLIFGQPLTITAQAGPTPPPDVTGPTGQVQFFDGPTMLNVVYLTNGSASLTTPNLGVGTHQISAKYLGDINWQPSTASAGAMVVTPTSASMSATSSVNPVGLGQPVTLTAIVQTPAGSPAATGSVTFNDGARFLGTASISNNRASVNVTFTQAGTHNIAIGYPGDSNYFGMQANLQQTVNPVAGTLTVTATPSQVAFGQVVTLSAQITLPTPAQTPSPTGVIQFFDGATSLGSFTVTSYGALMNLNALAVGTHRISASYGGDSNWVAAQSAVVNVTVALAPVTVTLTGSANAGGDVLTLTATVAAAYSGAGIPIPTGNVQFVDSATGKILATTPLTGRTGSLTIPSTADPIVAVYAGDTNFSGGTSPPVVQIAIVSAAAFTGVAGSVAPEELVTIFGFGFGKAATVNVIDSTRTTFPATVLYAGPTQINIAMPAGIADGPAMVVVTTMEGPVYSVSTNVVRVWPGLFSADASGKGPAAAQIIRVSPDGSQTTETVSGPIRFGSDTLYLVLYGTGFRNRDSLNDVSCTLGSVSLPTLYAGPQTQFPGLDQANVLLPSSLQGAGTLTATLLVGTTSSNSVMLAFP
jgi:uncharacterized protein (TIGR03437 family)